MNVCGLHKNNVCPANPALATSPLNFLSNAHGEAFQLPASRSTNKNPAL
jgi:hypothetical protein